MKSRRELLGLESGNILQGLSRETRINPVWAWESYRPSQKNPWDLAKAGHLFRRAGFGTTWKQLQDSLRNGPQKTIESLFHSQQNLEEFDRTFDEYESSAIGSDSTDGLRSWWLRRMIETPLPLQEKMTLFWHGHFAVSNSGVGNAGLMTDYIRCLRKSALGNFEELFHKVLHCPATYLYLGGKENRKRQPNTRFVQRILEDYCLGPEHFQDQDIRASAAAFSGWFVRRNQLRFSEREHDSSKRILFGRRGSWKIEDFVRIVLEQKALAYHIVGKLYRFLISETKEPPRELLSPLVHSFSSNWDIRNLVEKILRSNLFFSRVSIGQRVKSPIEFALSLILAHETTVSTTLLGNSLSQLGQDLYRPPTSKGWIGGLNWINWVTLLRRNHLAAQLLDAEGPFGKKLNPAGLMEKYAGAAGSKNLLPRLLLQRKISLRPELDQTRFGGERARLEAFLIATRPDFQIA